MKYLHAKSQCCRARAVRYGGKRRQCIQCKKTWTVRPQKRGRKRKRGDIQLLVRYLEHTTLSPRARSLLSGEAPDQFEARLQRSRDLFLRTTPWPKLPTDGPLIAVVDAVLKQFRGQFWTLYCIFLRRPGETQAVIVTPLLRAGRENQPGWQAAFAQLPQATKDAIRAVVCDGHRGPVYWARQNRKLLQRCHFHLLSAIQGRRSRGRKSNHRTEGYRIYLLVERCLNTADEEEAQRLLYQIDDEALTTTSRQLRGILLGFTRNYQDYRQYRYHPELRLPTTSNAAESFIGSLHELCHRSRGFATPRSFFLWICAYAKFKQTILCNGRHQQN